MLYFSWVLNFGVQLPEHGVNYAETRNTIRCVKCSFADVMNDSFSQYAKSSSVKDLHVASPRPSSRVLRDSTRAVEVNCILLSTGHWNTRMKNA